MTRRPSAHLALVLLALTLTACASAKPAPVQTGRGVETPRAAVPQTRTATAHGPGSKLGLPSGTTSPVGRALGRYKVGKPYQVAGVWYVPAEQPDYDAVGVASWYGDAFHGRPTANGEAFDMTLASAAHATLPLPSIVEVTNLENDRTVRLRVNDRGPFKPGRIIDVSRQAADQLGFRSKGVAQVRVRYVGPAPLDFGRDDLPAEPFLTASAPRKLAPTPTPTPPMPPPAPLALRQPSPTSLTPAYAIQAGAFANRGNADRAARALRGIATTEVREASVDGAVLYRVLVGEWPAREAAVAAVSAVARAGFPDARVVSGS